MEHSRLEPSKPCVSPWRWQWGVLQCQGAGVISSWTFSWWFGGEVSRTQNHQTPSSEESGVYMLVDSKQFTCPTWWGFWYLHSVSKILCVYPLRGNQGPAPRLHCCSLITAPVPASPPVLTSSYLNLLRTQASLVAQLVKNPPAMQETWVLIPGLGRSSGEGKGYPLQYSCLESQTRLSDFTFT